MCAGSQCEHVLLIMGHDQKKLNTVLNCPKVVFAFCGTDEDREVSASQGHISVR